MAESDVALVREQWEAWNDGVPPLEWAERYFGPEGRWATVPDLPDSEVHVGPASVAAMIEKLVASFGRYRGDAQEVLDGPDGVQFDFKLVGEGQRGNVPVDVQLYHVHRIADGRNAVVAAFLDRDQALAAAGITE